MAKDMWVTDFGLGDFEKCRYGWYFSGSTDPEYKYFAHAIYLLPGQMIPEHAHVKTDFPAKHESWMVEKGWVYNFSEVGDETPNAPGYPCWTRTDQEQEFRGSEGRRRITSEEIGDIPLYDGRSGRRYRR